VALAIVLAAVKAMLPLVKDSLRVYSHKLNIVESLEIKFFLKLLVTIYWNLPLSTFTEYLTFKGF
jgi:hypothetical protein